ncbi:hypothetical protein IV203_004112 [Nitzschia inconspicua]|uniref:Uncharacterized protein n=1 Tax=Nitzschia inconspicua TaxID=303405 RepID=A0A9K3L4Q0_9STRA|nr:hypothetical protein IV203_004112 [Nitzschia inconspicua]
MKRHKRCLEKASAVASMPAAAGAGAGAEASAGFAHASSVKDVQNVQEGILGASYMLVHLRKTLSSNDVEIKHTAMVQRDDDPELYAFLRRVKLKEFRSLVTGLRANPLWVNMQLWMIMSR